MLPNGEGGEKRPAGDADPASRAGKRPKLEPDAEEQMPEAEAQPTDPQVQPRGQAQGQTRVLTLADHGPISVALLEDQISPKNAEGAAAFAEAALLNSTALLPPSPRRRRTSPRPPIRNITKADIEALLPGSAFGHSDFVFAKKYWSVRDERALRKSWSEEDEAALRAQDSVSDAEVHVWIAMGELFQCQPPDLFRYGLKYDAPAGGGDAAFWERLFRLLPHPMWAGNIAILRYALQLAVIHRIGTQGHVDPLIPPWSHTEPSFIRWMVESAPAGGGTQRPWTHHELELAAVAEFRSRVQVQRKTGMEKLDLYMEETSSGAYDQTYLTVPTFERFLFMLEEEDLALLTQALDATYDPLVKMQGGGDGKVGSDSDTKEQGAGPQRGPNVAELFKAYWDGLPVERKTPTDGNRKWVADQRRLAIIAERREAMIRHRILAAGESDVHVLLDIPPFDPDPYYHLYPEVREAQLLVVWGLRVSPSTHQWARGQFGPDTGRLNLWVCEMMARAIGGPIGAAGDLCYIGEELI